MSWHNRQPRRMHVGQQPTHQICSTPSFQENPNGRKNNSKTGWSVSSGSYWLVALQLTLSRCSRPDCSIGNRRTRVREVPCKCQTLWMACRYELLRHEEGYEKKAVYNENVYLRWMVLLYRVQWLWRHLQAGLVGFGLCCAMGDATFTWLRTKFQGGSIQELGTTYACGQNSSGFLRAQFNC